MAMRPAAEVNEPIKRIVIVDPNSQFSVMLRSVLGKGYNVEQVRAIQEGAERLRGAPGENSSPLASSAKHKHFPRKQILLKRRQHHLAEPQQPAAGRGKVKRMEARQSLHAQRVPNENLTLVRQTPSRLLPPEVIN